MCCYSLGHENRGQNSSLVLEKGIRILFIHRYDAKNPQSIQPLDFKIPKK